MKKYIVIIVLLVSFTAAVLIVRKQKKDQTAGLGKATVPNKPPKVKIVYSKTQKPHERVVIGTSADAYKVFKDIWSNQIDTREEMIILLLDRSNSVLGYHFLSMGGITGTVADIRLVFSIALNSLATSIIMCHNHPSGNLKPSDADINLTRRIRDTGKVMDITLLDHLIINNNNYCSMVDEYYI
ncbi:MAG: JAB domain-containing protein [Bacteroidales bacterium]